MSSTVTSSTVTSSSKSSRKKVLLMGKSGSGKSSMRAIIFKSQLAADTRRLGATIDVESSQIKFLGGLRLDLWDCGGQDSFMHSHLTSQSSTIFRSVHSLIYIFDAESPDLASSDTHYFLKCLAALRDQNPSAASTTSPLLPTTSTLPQSSTQLSQAEASIADGPTIFVLLHKMDLVPVGQEATKLAEFSADLVKRAGEAGWRGAPLQFFGTSIWNETLYKAWSNVITHLMPSLASLQTHLAHFLAVTSAAEVVLFERTTFLVISSVTADSVTSESGASTPSVSQEWDERRFERISTMVKAFKLGCSKIRAPFNSLTVCTQHYTAVLDTLTPETYILVIGHGGTEPAEVELNIKLARPHFSKLEAIGLSG